MIAFLDNWRLPKKLLAAFALLAVLLCVVGLNGYNSSTKLNAVAQSHLQHGVAGMSRLSDVLSDAKGQQITLYAVVNAANADERSAQLAAYTRQADELEKAINHYDTIVSDALKPEVALLRTKIGALAEVDALVIEEAQARRTGDALRLIREEAMPRAQAVREQTYKLVELSRTESDRSAAEGSAAANYYILLSIIIAVLGLAGITAIWAMINRSVAKPMAEIAEVTETLANGAHVHIPYCDRGDEIGDIARALQHFRDASDARKAADARIAANQELVTTTMRDSLSALTNGDLSRTITQDFPPAYAELKTNFNAAIASLRTLIGAVAESAIAIRTGSSEIAQASEDLARRTESNAASLEQTSAAITQMDSRLRATAEAAGRTVARADGAMNVVASGRSVTDQAVQAMGRVSDSAKGIDSVIEGLDKIAFQTRVLAMNAAVEAGRAGDAGRGFAVVADLVSALAMRSEEEAKRAREQLTATQTDIGTAVHAVQKVDGALEDISSDVAAVHGLLNEIAADNQAQSSTITEISAAIGSMDHSTQQNAAMVEETSAAARNLSTEVSSLADRAAMFTVGDMPRSTFVAPTMPARGPQSRPMASSASQAAASVSDDDWLEF